MIDVDLKINSVQVQSESRKMRVEWTPELLQDLQVYQGINAEEELRSILDGQMNIAMRKEARKIWARNARRAEKIAYKDLVSQWLSE